MIEEKFWQLKMVKLKLSFPKSFAYQFPILSLESGLSFTYLLDNAQID